MKSLPWRDGAIRAWSSQDAADAWMVLQVHAKNRNEFFDKAASAVTRGHGNTPYLIAGAAEVFPDFAELCKAPVEALEAMREMAERESFIWCILTAAVLWHESPLERLPINAPTKLP